MKIINLTEKLIILTISIIFALFISELIIRKFNLAPQVVERFGQFRLIDNPKIAYEFIPGAKVDDSIINKQGFKDSDFEQKVGKDIVRIAMLGDSITEGMKVPYGKTFSDVLEIILNQKANEQKSRFRYEVMNFGVGGYNLEAEVELLKNKVIEYTPAIVVLNLAPNDNEPIPGLHLWFVHNNGLSEEQRYLIYKKYYSDRNPLINSFVTRVIYKSKLLLFLIDRFARTHNNIIEFSKYISRHHCSEMDDREAHLIYGYLYEIKQLRQKYGFNFLICLHSALLSGEPSNVDKFAELAKKLDLPAFHIFEYYKAKAKFPDSITLIRGDYCHPNEFGHKIIAEAIFEELKKKHFIDLQ